MLFGGMFNPDDYDPLNFSQPGLYQGGSQGLPVPGGMDYGPSQGMDPVYFGPGSELGTAPWVPYTPPEVGNVGPTGFDELDPNLYSGLLTDHFPERLEDPYAGWGLDPYPGTDAPPPSLPPGGVAPPPTPGAGGGAPSNPWTTGELMELMQQGGPRYRRSTSVLDWMDEQGLGTGQRQSVLGEMDALAAALGPTFFLRDVDGGNN